MEFETGLVSKIQEITGLKLYPSYAQEGVSTPYAVYNRRNTEYIRKLETVDDTLGDYMFEISLITDRKSDNVSISDSIESKLKEMYQSTVGGEYIQDIIIENRFTQWEPEVERFREIIEFTVFY